MKTIATLLLFVSATVAFGQSAIDRYYGAYRDDNAFTHVSFSSKMFELFTHIEGATPEEQEVLAAIAKLKGMQMIVGPDRTDAQAEYQAALRLPDGEFEELMVVRQEGEEFSFMIREENGVISELLMVGYQQQEFFVMSIFGDIDLKQMRKLARALDIDGMQHLEKIEAE